MKEDSNVYGRCHVESKS